MNETYNKKLRRYDLDSNPCYYILRSSGGNNKMSMYCSRVGAVVQNIISTYLNLYTYDIETLAVQYDRQFIFAFEI